MKLVAGVMLGVLVAGAAAQDCESRRSFVLVVDGALVTQNGSWHRASKLRQYALSHGGSYVAFEDGGALYRVNSPAVLAEAQRLYAPMVPLATEQEKLAEKMRPLEEQQEALQKKMQTAVGPEGVGKVGQEMGAVGRQQGEIGREQGRVGRQQGVIGKALNAAFEKVADDCLAAGSCSKVE